MKTKLTLLIDKRRVAEVKSFVGKRNTTVSKLVEDYFDSISALKKYELSPEIKQWFYSLPKGKIDRNIGETIYERHKSK